MLESKVCTRCGEDKSSFVKDFYASYSSLFKSRKRMVVCKDCIVSIYDENLKTYGSKKSALYHACQLLDSYYEEGIFSSSIKQAEPTDTSVARIYFQKINSLPQYRGRTFKDSEEFELEVIEGSVEDIMGDFEVTNEMITRFGKADRDEDYFFLSNEFDDWASRFKEEELTKPIEVLIVQICWQTLDIEKRRSAGKEVDKQLKTLQELMASGNLKPAQESLGDDDNDNLGMLIKKWENQRPIPEASPLWKDVDGIKKYIDIWFLGHLSKMLGIKNQNAEAYEQEVAKYNVDLDNVEDDDFVDIEFDFEDETKVDDNK